VCKCGNAERIRSDAVLDGRAATGSERRERREIQRQRGGDRERRIRGALCWTRDEAHARRGVCVCALSRQMMRTLRRDYVMTSCRNTRRPDIIASHHTRHFTTCVADASPPPTRYGDLFSSRCLAAIYFCFEICYSHTASIFQCD